MTKETEREQLLREYSQALNQQASVRYVDRLPQPGELVQLGDAFYRVGVPQLRERVELQVKFRVGGLGLDHGCGA